MGVHSTTSTGSGGGDEVTVEHAAAVRAGLDAPRQVQVRRMGGFGGPVTLVGGADYFDIDEKGRRRLADVEPAVREAGGKMSP